MDSYRHRGMRAKLCTLLQSKGISNIRVLDAMNTVPRHAFLDTALEEQAYQDKALPIASGQTISHPYTVAYQTQLLNPQDHEKILEIGTGSGYQAAVLSHICKRVYSIERQESLYKTTAALLNHLGYTSIRTLFGDGYKGSPRFAPFDKILVTAGASSIPEELLDQLKPGGQMVIPFGSGENKRMLRITETEGTYKQESFGTFRFVPFLQGVANG